LNEASFGRRMRGRGPFAQLIEQLFAGACRRNGINTERLRLRTDLFRRPRTDAAQLPLFAELDEASGRKTASQATTVGRTEQDR
jgi:hypothetical protein